MLCVVNIDGRHWLGRLFGIHIICWSRSNGTATTGFSWSMMDIHLCPASDYSASCLNANYPFYSAALG